MERKEMIEDLKNEFARKIMDQQKLVVQAREKYAEIEKALKSCESVVNRAQAKLMGLNLAYEHLGGENDGDIPSLDGVRREPFDLPGSGNGQHPEGAGQHPAETADLGVHRGK